MALLRALVGIRRDTGLPEDVSTNTLYFTTPGADLVADGNVIIARILKFFDQLSTGQVTKVSNYMASVNQQGHVTKIYNMADAKPRSPIVSSDHEWTSIGATSLPEEVAVALSFRAPLISGTNAARRRGRIFLGPLASSCAAIDGGRVRLPQAVATDILLASHAIYGNPSVSAIKWVVHSPTTGPASVVDVSDGWIDRTLDTIRSRGPATTGRSSTTYPI